MEHVRTKLKTLTAALRVLLCLFALTVLAETSFASPQINTACPLNFFTNVASRLLSSQLNVNLTCIQIYPTNQYTPAVHRLLQVTANIYDATTTNYYPSVFRPLFWKTNEVNNSGATQTCIYLAGYQYVQEPLTASGPIIFNPPQDAADPTIPFGFSATNNIYGVPWVIGVKKGLPNFNGLEVDSTFYVERDLQFNRRNANQLPSTSSFANIAAARGLTTNQMYKMGVINTFGMEDWNSYANNYTNTVAIFAQENFGFALSNLDNPSVSQAQINNTFSVSTNVFVQPWLGNPSLPSTPSAASFILPLGTNVVSQNLSPLGTPPSTSGLYTYFYGSAFEATNLDGFTYVAPCFIPMSANPAPFIDPGTLQLPHLAMMTTNRVQAWILDFGPNGNSAPYILDYVQLGGMNSSLDVNQAISTYDTDGLFSTNIIAGGAYYGINQQFLINEGLVQAPPYSAWPNTDPNFAKEVATFQGFFTYDNAGYYNGTTFVNTNLSVEATPVTMAIVNKSVYQANDPLVHYLASDLTDLADFTTNSVIVQSVQTAFQSIQQSNQVFQNLGRVSDRYMPWGTAGNLPSFPYADNNPYNLAYKDPLVHDSDDWDFPTNETLNASWLGQVHRGTPWQTIFLKSTNILELTSPLYNFPSGFFTWQLWTGDLNISDAINIAPVQDWRMAGLLASLFNTNNIASLFSVNNPSPNAWENLLNGMTVLTNDLTDTMLNFYHNTQRPAQFATLAISSSSPQAATIANAIQSTRIASPGQIIADVGDIFAIPQLSDASPYLNAADSVQVQYGVSDIAYEAIPDQLLPLLWEDSLGSPSLAGGQMVIQFTGDDNYSYAVQSSCDLVYWTSISTNSPVNGIFNFTNTATAKARFYRTILIQ
jgi:hypothetical protein